jgi:hypothetical protein
MYPRVKKVKTLKNYKLEITFLNGEVGIFECDTILDLGIFKELKNESYFQMVFVSNGTCVWPNGQDICPDTLYMDSKKTNKPPT